AAEGAQVTFTAAALPRHLSTPQTQHEADPGREPLKHASRISMSKPSLLEIPSHHYQEQFPRKSQVSQEKAT
ncbi:hypothetical protein TNIN_42121, partial [Trichonephila inaurata madagascariensis]